MEAWKIFFFFYSLHCFYVLVRGLEELSVPVFLFLFLCQRGVKLSRCFSPHSSGGQ